MFNPTVKHFYTILLATPSIFTTLSIFSLPSSCCFPHSLPFLQFLTCFFAFFVCTTPSLSHLRNTLDPLLTQRSILASCVAASGVQLLLTILLIASGLIPNKSASFLVVYSGWFLRSVLIPSNAAGESLLLDTHGALWNFSCRIALRAFQLSTALVGCEAMYFCSRVGSVGNVGV